VKSGPDVFADALVPRAAAIHARRSDFQIVFDIDVGSLEERDCVSGARPSRNGYRFAKRHGKPNSAIGR
jgi:hypothetical protein